MFVANAALLSIAGAVNQPLPVRFVTVVVGLFLSWSWLLINSKGGYYVSRWRPVIEALEEEMLKRKCFPVTPLKKVRPDSEAFAVRGIFNPWKIIARRNHPRTSAVGIMHIVIIGFVFAWAALGLYYTIWAGDQPPSMERTAGLTIVLERDSLSEPARDRQPPK